jgi:hypothetical protein
MRDVEELLRDTVTDTRRRLDPPPAFYDGVRRRATARRHRQLAAGAAALAVVALATTGSVLAVSGSEHQHVTPAGPAPTSVDPLRGSEGAPVQIGDTWYAAADTVATSSALYVLGTDPSQIVKLDAAGGQVLATADGPTGTPSGLAIDGNRLWAWSGDLRDIRAYDADSLKVVGTFSAQTPMFNAVAVGGGLDYTSSDGLMRLTFDGGNSLVNRLNAGLGAATYGLAVDSARQRVLVGVTTSGTASPNDFATRVVALDSTTGAVIATSPPLGVGKESIAVVGGEVWVGGFTGGDERRIEHLDATTLQIVGSSPVNESVGPGAILWPGENVLWVRSGGDQGLYCVDPKSGDVLEKWPDVQGPVTSIAGRAYAVVGNVVRLNLNAACAAG